MKAYASCKLAIVVVAGLFLVQFIAAANVCSSAPTLVAAVSPSTSTYLKQVAAAYVTNRSVVTGYTINFTFVEATSVYGLQTLEAADDAGQPLTFAVSSASPLLVADKSGAPVTANVSANAVGSYGFAATNLAIVYNLPNINVQINLSISTLALIYMNLIDFWNDTRIQSINPNVKLPGQTIIVVARSDVSDDTRIFTQILAKSNTGWAQKYGQNGFDTPAFYGNVCCNSSNWLTSVDFYAEGVIGMFGLVQSIPFSIGYAALGDTLAYSGAYAQLQNADGNFVQATSVDAVQDTMEYVQNNTNFKNQQFFMNLKSVAEPEAYPISYLLSIVYNYSHVYNDCCVAQEFLGFVYFLILSQNADAYATQNSLVPLIQSMKNLILNSSLNNATCGHPPTNVFNVTELQHTTRTFTRQQAPNYALIFGLVGGALVVLVAAGATAFWFWRKRRQKREEQHWTLPSGGVHIDAEQPDDTSKWLAVVLEDGERAMAYAVPVKSAHLKQAAKAAISNSYHLNHRFSPNVARFVGIWHRQQKIESTLCVLVEHCAKGTLHGVLQQATRYNFDENPAIIYCMASDIAEGVKYLHKKGITHGTLNPLNCLVDDSWRVKVAGWLDFQLIRAENTDESLLAAMMESRRVDAASLNELIRLLYVDDVKPLAPEGDVYSYGLLLIQIFTRRLPFAEHFTFDDVDEQMLINFLHAKHVVRQSPELGKEIPPPIRRIVNVCISSFTEERPAFTKITESLGDLCLNKKRIVDAMRAADKAYTSKLEAELATSTALVRQISQTRDELFSGLLPSKIARVVLAGGTVPAEFYECATICFAGLGNFEAIVSSAKPTHVAHVLDGLWTAFDVIIAKFDACKVQTISGSWAICSGLPDRNDGLHVRDIASVALALVDLLSSFHLRRYSTDRLRIQIGLASGPITAAVVGSRMPRYCVLGDTVNTASRLESTSEPMRIHTSSLSAKMLEDRFSSLFGLSARGQRDCGEPMETYWLSRAQSVMVVDDGQL